MEDNTRDLLFVAPKTICHAKKLGNNAVDLPMKASTEPELYDMIEEAIRQNIGCVLFARVMPEDGPSGWYCRLQFIKPEDMITL